MIAFYLSMLETDDEKDKMERIYYLYRDVMFYVANHILDNYQQAEDAIHQAFLHIIEKFDEIGDVDCPQTKSLFIIIVRNISIDMLRKNAKHDSTPYEEIFENISNEAQTEDEVTEIAEQKILANSIEKLPISYRDILLLKYGNDLSTKQIAKALNISNDAAKKQLQRAKKALENLLIESCDFINETKQYSYR